MQFSLIKFPSFVLIGTLMLSSCSSNEKHKEKDITEITELINNQKALTNEGITVSKTVISIKSDVAHEVLVSVDST